MARRSIHGDLTDRQAPPPQWNSGLWQHEAWTGLAEEESSPTSG